ncbi:MAG: AgmX/PglI C-terminal domain-containing protein [Chloroherpetonaceae bacterium]|nr:AgmX/PglI C-terminal domain-containing protein [Chloroherpetonaceae bacterium]MDW8438567.1 AgmX/PglI C-terminal domain-containing protein [Chloroherpetonaceae bacterium]
MKQTLLVVIALLLCSLTTFAQNRREMVQARNDDNLPPRKLSQIDSVIVKHQLALEECYREAKNYDPSVRGKLVVRLSVTPDGRVKNVSIPRDDIANTSLDSCLTRKLRRLHFTRTSSKEGDQTFDLPLNFSDADDE